MSPLLSRNRLRGSSGTGVLAGRALLVVTEYVNRSELPEDGAEILTRFRERYDEARDEAKRRSLRANGAASVDVLAASHRALEALSAESGDTEEPTLDDVLSVLDELRLSGRTEPDRAELLREFLRRFALQEREQETAGVLLGSVFR